MVEFTNNLPTPGPENVWGAELNAAINERVNFLNDEIEDIKTSLDINPNLFRGVWQAPANFLLWSTLFSTELDTSYFEVSHDGSSFNVTPARNSNSSSSGAAIGIGSTTAITYSYSVPATSTAASSTLTLDTEAIPQLSGKYINRLEFMVNPTHGSSAAWRTTTITVNDVVESTIRTNSTATTWIAKTLTVNMVNPIIGFKYADTSGTGTAYTGRLYLSELKVYGTANNSDLYQMHHVVQHAGTFWRSLYNNNSDLPSSSSPMWVEVPDFITP